MTYPTAGSPIANGTSLIISRTLPLTQQTSISNQDNIYPQVIESALDTLCMEIQQVSARTGQFRGTWIPGVVYNYGDMVQDGANGLGTGNYYFCAIANTASSSWANDLAAGDWVLAIVAATPTLTLPLNVAQGGTGASTASQALTNLGALAIVNNLSDVANASTALSNIFPSGIMVPYAGATAPTGWLLCYGQAVSRTTYANLFAAISTAWGNGDGSTTFNVPDMRGNVPAGVDNMGGSAANRITNAISGITGTTLGASGGNQSMQTHTHTVTDPGHTHNTSPNGLWTNQVGSAVGTSAAQANSSILTLIPSATTGITNANTGAGSSQNVQPTAMVNYIIKE